METTSHAHEPRRGGWGWVFLPLLLMMLGANIVWGLFMLKFGDPAEAGKETFRVGPVTWSILQLVLLWIAHRELRKMGRSLKDLIGYRPSRLRDDILLALGLAVVSVLVIAAFTQIISRLLPPTEEEVTFYPWALVWWTVIGSLTAGIGEEAYFRGFLMERLKWMKPGWLLVVTSLGFALWHGNPLIFPHTFVLGLLYGWVYLREKRLFPVMVGHALTNFIGGVLMALGWL